MRYHELTESEQARLPNPGETPFWVAPLERLTNELKGDYWNSWAEGGCWAFATALKAAIGGTLCGICEPCEDGGWATNHAMVYKNGRYYDYSGVVDPQKYIAEYERERGVPQKVLTSRNPQFEVYEDDFCNDEQWAYLHKVLRQLRPSRRKVTEAPIEDYAFIDHSDRPRPRAHDTPAGNSFPDEDLRGIRNPKWQAKLFKTFGKTVPINLYIFNKGEFEHTDTRTTTDGDIVNKMVSNPSNPHLIGFREWHGAYTAKDFEQTFGFLPPNYEQCINILLTQNWGDGRVPLTPWIVAHRIIHALITDDTLRLKGPHWHAFTRAWNSGRMLVGRLERAWNYTMLNRRDMNAEEQKDFYRGVATFASARNGSIERSGEFIVELMTQYFLTGKVSLKLDWCNHDKEVKDYIVRELNEFEDLLMHAFDCAEGQLVVF